MLYSYKDAYKKVENNTNYTTNNKYKYFPPKMSDSRSLVSSTQPISVTDYYLKNGKSNWGYREYLKNNAKNIQNEMEQKSLNDIGYYQRYINNESQYPDIKRTNIPYFFASLFDNNKPFGYQDSDAKQIYLTKQQLNARLMSPKIHPLSN